MLLTDANLGLTLPLLSRVIQSNIAVLFLLGSGPLLITPRHFV